MDIQVIKIDPITRQVSFQLQAKKLTGIEKLVQIVVISLLTTPDGRSVIYPNKGAGMMTLVGVYNLDSNISSELFSEVARMVKKAELEIIESQIGINDPDSEKLAEIQIVNIKQGTTSDSLLVQLRVVNQAGQISDVMV